VSRVKTCFVKYTALYDIVTIVKKIALFVTLIINCHFLRLPYQIARNVQGLFACASIGHTRYVLVILVILIVVRASLMRLPAVTCDL
jgi:hypothetical protein